MSLPICVAMHTSSMDTLKLLEGKKKKKLLEGFHINFIELGCFCDSLLSSSVSKLER